MDPFFCLLCSRTSFLDERFNCIHCGNGLESWTVFADNLNPQVPEPENGCQVPAMNAGNQMSQEYLNLVEPTREANNQMSEENCNLSLQIAGSHGYENCLKSDGPSQNRLSHDFDLYKNANQNSLLTNSNANEGEFHNQSYDICHPATLVEAVYDTPVASQQTYLSEESTVSECENKYSSDEMLRRQGTKGPTERGIKSDRFLFTDSISLESEYPALNLLSDTFDKVEDGHDKDSIPTPFSFCPEKNTSMNKCFQENLVTAQTVVNIPPNISSFRRRNSSVNKSFQENPLTSKTLKQKNPQSSNKFKIMRCKKCGRYLKKLSTFIVHVQNNCNPIPFKCGQCDERFSCRSQLIEHGSVHTEEKPFKCTQCDYATKWPRDLKKHLETHR